MKVEFPTGGWYSINLTMVHMEDNEISDSKTIRAEIPEAGLYTIDFTTGEVSRYVQQFPRDYELPEIHPDEDM